MAAVEKLIDNFKKWFDEFEKKNLPSYEELPEIELYMQQLIYYLKIESRSLETSNEDHQITTSMINNYVKAKIVDQPNKKKYSKDQICQLLEIIYLKKVLTLPEIKQIFDVTYKDSSETAYKNYSEIKRQATKKAVQDAKIQLNNIDYTNKNEVVEAALDLAAKANAYAVISKRLLHLQGLTDYAETKDEIIEKALKEHTQNTNLDEHSEDTDLENDI